MGAIDPSLALELLNGAGAIIGISFLGLMARYLILESRRRHLRWRDWIFDLPPSMHLAVAIFVCDLGVSIRTSLIWYWRHFGDGNFTVGQMVTLGIGAAIIVIGSLCKIRSITKPDLGDGPWLLSLAAVVLFGLVIVLMAR
jgi:hypothetical protein